MNKLVKIKERQKAAEMMAFNPEMSVKEIAITLKVAPTTVLNWR